MSLKIGIVGLPNVGKSTIFNVLVKKQAALASNFPFATIEPNVGIVDLPDERLNQIAKIISPEKIVPATVKFVDIAGLIKGAHKGEGLGNKFLAHIREVDAIAMVVRGFSDPNVTHVSGTVNPKQDMEDIYLELVYADLETVTKSIDRMTTQARSGDKEAKLALEILESFRLHLEMGRPLVKILNEDSKKLAKQLGLMTSKPVLFMFNVDESEVAKSNGQDLLTESEFAEGAPVIPISARMEEELQEMTPEEQAEYLDALGVKEPGLNRVIREAFRLLGLQTYFTAGVQEVRAWTINVGDTAPQSAGVIHTDFERGFIKAEVISFKDFIENGGEQGAKSAGKLRIEGKDYIVKDGDIIHFRFNV